MRRTQVAFAFEGIRKFAKGDVGMDKTISSDGFVDESFQFDIEFDHIGVAIGELALRLTT